MSNKFENGLFIFRRDLRIVDNNGLNLLDLFSLKTPILYEKNV
jgi:hypothetical protein